MTRRSGMSAMGCLFTIVIVGCVLFIGSKVGRVYWRFYEYQDNMRQAVRFAAKSTNEQILVTLRAHADSLDLPADATKINIRRGGTGISIESEYIEHLAFPGYARDITFHPHAEGPI